MRLKEIDHNLATPFIERWHYSGCAPKGSNTYFGWFKGDALYAVADYGIGVNPYQASYLSNHLGEEIKQDQLVELKRLVRSEPKLDRNPLTKFLSKCHRILKDRGIRLVVSFSDPAQGHQGGIYKAANFSHVGKTQAEYHTIDTEGNIRHRRYAYRYAKRNSISTEAARVVLGLTPIKTEPKDRWCIWIDRSKKATGAPPA